MIETTTELSPGASEESTYIIRGRFYDENSVAVTPNALTWTLTDAAGTVINSRENIVITPGTVVDIGLSGDDLAILTGESDRVFVWRYLVIEGNYDSAFGSGLPIRSQCKFAVTNLRGVS